jgi:hypothetical protein
MGKASRTKKHGAKMARKRAVKAARRAEYAAKAGTSKKAKKCNRKTGPTVMKGAHVMADCGNVGCKRCYPKLNYPSPNVLARKLKVQEV